MKVKELINKLEQYDGEAEVKIDPPYCPIFSVGSRENAEGDEVVEIQH